MFLSAYFTDSSLQGTLKTFFTSSFITLDVYLRPGIYFCYDAVYPKRLNGTRRVYETSHNLRRYGN